MIKEKTITLADKEVTIKKLYLGDYAEVIGALDNLPDEVKKTVTNLDVKNEAEILGLLPGIFKNAFPSFIDLLSKASGLDKEFLAKEMDALDTAVLISTIFELNRINEVKKMLLVAWRAKQPATTPDTGSKK